MSKRVSAIVAALVLCAGTGTTAAQLHVDEQHGIRWHTPDQVIQYRRPSGPAPVTVATKDVSQIERFLSLDEAIQIALQHSEVIRVLTGTGAASSGRTIYDAAIANTQIDQTTGVFDPVFNANSTWRKTEVPFATVDPGDPDRALIFGDQRSQTDLSARIGRTNRLGGTSAMTFGHFFDRRGPGIVPLDPAHRPSLEISYIHPLLQGAGRAVNEAPIVIARLETDRSYFRFKDGMQELVRSVIVAYWTLVQARTELWAREKQVEQGEEQYRLAEAELRIGRKDIANRAQANVAYTGFKANLIAAQANVIQREAALRNLLGLPPADGEIIVPSTPPARQRVEFDWDQTVATAQDRRPDLIELNLILLADQQRLIQQDNSARPRLNGEMTHRWNGLSGRMLDGSSESVSFDDNTSWTLGINFEVPLGLRSARARLRSTELVIARDRANIQQGLHATEHTLATTIRSLDQNFLQYKAFQEVREAARLNLEAQTARERANLTILLNVLTAINSWGDSVAAEAQALTQYNSQLATLEYETGTILDVHGVVFVEERYASIGPYGRHFENSCYAMDIRPDGSSPRYEDSGKAAEAAFDLENYPGSDRDK